MPRQLIENIGPQPGKQEAFLASKADIVIYGGSAGSGKSYGLLLAPLYHRTVQGFHGIIFRRVFSEITQPGGLWDEAQELYNKIGAKIKGKPEYTINFTDSSKLVFRHLEHESDKFSHQGGQYCYIGFDEVTLFTETMVMYLLSRNRSSCGVKPFMRCTCNPEADSWVKKWIKWWLDEDTGYPIPERSGKLQYFTRGDDGELKWVDRWWRHPEHSEIGPKSITFIPAKLDDNPLLLQKDPTYKANLLTQSKIDRLRLLEGNWNAKPDAGMFRQEWFEVRTELPQPTSRKIRIWDRANTEKDIKNRNPDWTAGVLGYLSGDILCIEDLQHFRESPAKNEEKILLTAQIDGRDVEIIIEREPASSGKDIVFHYKERILKDFVVRDFRPSGSRADAAKPLSALNERRKIWIKTAPWNREFFNEFAVFPPSSGAGHDDIVCACSQLLNELTQEYRVISGYSSKNLTEKKVLPEGYEYAVLYQEKDLRLYACFFRWDYHEKILYLYDELVMQNFTVPQINAIIKEKCKLAPIIYCNNFMFQAGDSIVRLLGRLGMAVTESPRFNDEGAIPVVSQMFSTRQIYIHVRCVETDRQLRNWMIENGKPTETRIGCAKCVCMVISDLRDKQKIVPPEPPKPYSKERQALQQAPISPTAMIAKELPRYGYSRRIKSWMA